MKNVHRFKSIGRDEFLCAFYSIFRTIDLNVILMASIEPVNSINLFKTIKYFIDIWFM